jgi:hypothetical protein
MNLFYFLQFFSLNGKKWIDDVTLISHDKPIRAHHATCHSLEFSLTKARP